MIQVTTEVTDFQGIPLTNIFTANFVTGDTTVNGRIVFHRTSLYDEGTAQGIFLMNGDGSNLYQLTKDNQVKDTQPDWSPDGSRMVFIRYYWYGNENWEIFLMNSDGTFPENISNNPMTPPF